MTRRQDTPLGRLLAERARRRFEDVKPEVDATLAALRGAGVTVEVVGSYARRGFWIGSDVDFLSMDRAALSMGEVFLMLFES